MSAVAGRMSIQAGAHSLEKNQKGRGLLLGGAPGVEPANVVIDPVDVPTPRAVHDNNDLHYSPDNFGQSDNMNDSMPNTIGVPIPLIPQQNDHVDAPVIVPETTPFLKCLFS